MILYERAYIMILLRLTMSEKLSCMYSTPPPNLEMSLTALCSYIDFEHD